MNTKEKKDCVDCELSLRNWLNRSKSHATSHAYIERAMLCVNVEEFQL